MERKKSWVLAFRYADMQAAGRAYARARDIVFGEDIDASAFRVKLNGMPYVIVLGEGELEPNLR